METWKLVFCTSSIKIEETYIQTLNFMNTREAVIYIAGVTSIRSNMEVAYKHYTAMM